MHFCGIPNDSGGEGDAFILEAFTYSLLSFLLGLSKASGAIKRAGLMFSMEVGY